jgi:MoaA/NifB/PqqE/SkfB family radical SAM enzyme
MYAYVNITSLCNSRCKYCDNYKNEVGNEPTTEEWKTIIDDLAEMGVLSLTFSGGEPFIRKDLFELASYAKSRDLFTMVVTNLSFFKKHHIKKISKNFDFFGISIDATKPKIYRELRGVDWLERIKHNILELMYGLTKIRAETEVCAMVTISNRNAYEMHEIIHMVFDELKMDTISYNLLDPHGSTTAKEFVPTTEQINYARKVILDHKSLYPISNSKRYLSQLGNFDYKCSPWKCVEINYNGFLVAPCLYFLRVPYLFLNGGVVNLRKHRLLDMWNSKQIQKIYSKHANCKKCNLGCVAEAVWSAYELKFAINESFLGMILPTIKRIKQRNNGSIKKPICKFNYSVPVNN